MNKYNKNTFLQKLNQSNSNSKSKYSDFVDESKQVRKIQKEQQIETRFTSDDISKLFDFHKGKDYTANQMDLIMNLYRTFNTKETLTNAQYYLLKTTVQNNLIKKDPSTMVFAKPLTGSALILYENTLKYYNEHNCITARQLQALESIYDFLKKY